MNACAKYFDKNKCMNLLVYDICDKIKNLFGKKIDSDPVCNDKYIKTKVNSYNANFYGNKTPMEGKHYTYFSVYILLLMQIKNIIHRYS